MLTIDNVLYLLTDVLGISSQSIASCSINEGSISVQFKTRETVYQEALFDFDSPVLTNDDYELLTTICFECVKSQKNDSALKNLYKTISVQDISFLKLAHYFVNEHYLSTPQILDDHKRVTSESVYSDVIQYLNYPMVDVLIDIFTFRYLATTKQNGTVYFTSDFDYINLWKYLGFFKTIWRFIKHCIFLRRLLLIEEFWSLWLSQKFLRRNFMLTNKMFLFKETIGQTLNVKNIAFLLVHKSHKKYDYKNDFSILPFKEYLFTNIGHVAFGLHPSYNTRYEPETMEKQIEKFEQAVIERPRYSRFHYLNCSYPNDLLPLEKSRITQDFSFYFCDKLMFRGCITRPFKQWSYSENRAIDVEIIPLTIMDVTLSKTLTCKYNEALSLAKEKIRLSLLLGNSCVLLWHNNEMYEPLYRKNYSRKLLLALKNYIEELEMVR